MKQGSKYSWSISQAPYFMWSPDCEEKLGASTNDVMNDIKFSLNAVTGHENLYLYSTIYLILTAALVFMYMWLFFLNKCNCWVFCFQATYFIEILVFISQIVFLILIAVSLSHMNNVFLSSPVKTT